MLFQLAQDYNFGLLGLINQLEIIMRKRILLTNAYQFTEAQKHNGKI